MTSPHSFLFAAYRIASEAPHLRELGSVSELGLRLARGTTEIAERSIMEGSLAEFDIPTLLQTVGASRQCCALEILDELTPAGRIVVKAGVVVSAAAGEITGLSAILHLIATPERGWFRVLRLGGELPTDEPIGPIGRVLLELETRRATPDDPAEVLDALAPRRLPGRPAPRPPRAVPRASAIAPLLGTPLIGAPPVAAAGVGPGAADAEPSPYPGIADAAVLRGQLRPRQPARAQPPLQPQSPQPQPPPQPPALDAEPAPVRASSWRMLRWLIPLLAGAGVVGVLLIRDMADPPPAMPRAAPETTAPTVAQTSIPAPTTPAPTTPAPTTPAPTIPATARTAAPGLPAESIPRMTIMNAQLGLQQLGYDPGRVDGAYGRMTRTAVLRFQQAQGLRATGVVDRATWNALVSALAAQQAR
jgi:hypothetical protein